MTSLAQQLGGLRCPPISTTRLSKHYFKSQIQRPDSLRAVSAASASVGILNAETRERLRLKQMFQEARERCLTDPMDGLYFTDEDFHSTLQKYHMGIQLDDKVKGTVSNTDSDGAEVDLNWKFSAFLPVEEACIHNISHVEEAGIVPGMLEEFEVVGKSKYTGSFILSLRKIQCDLAWERCRQLKTEDAVVKGKVVGERRGGVVAMVEGLPGFIPFSQISTKSEVADLFEKELPLKFMEVNEEESTLVLSNSKAMADSHAQLEIGSVVVGTVQSLKAYGAFVDIGGLNGLLHISQISHDRVADIATVLQPGDTLKVMILSHDQERGRLSLSTKKLEPTPGDMIHNPELVFEKAEEMAQTFKKRIAQAEAMARADMLRFQPESGLTLSSDGILGLLARDFPLDRLDLTDIPPA